MAPDMEPKKIIIDTDPGIGNVTQISVFQFVYFFLLTLLLFFWSKSIWSRKFLFLSSDLRKKLTLFFYQLDTLSAWFLQFLVYLRISTGFCRWCHGNIRCSKFTRGWSYWTHNHLWKCLHHSGNQKCLAFGKNIGTVSQKGLFSMVNEIDPWLNNGKSLLPYLHMQLEVAGRTDIPVAEGSHLTLTVSLSYFDLYRFYFIAFVLGIVFNIWAFRTNRYIWSLIECLYNNHIISVLYAIFIIFSAHLKFSVKNKCVVLIFYSQQAIIFLISTWMSGKILSLCILTADK